VRDRGKRTRTTYTMPRRRSGSVDYMFFRNQMPSRPKLQAELEHSPGRWAVFAIILMFIVQQLCLQALLRIVASVLG
jgi:hypothetical protein